MSEIFCAISTCMPWIFPIFFGFGGVCIGSLLNVCIQSMPLDKSVIHSHSHCHICGAHVAWRDNIPILSWILLRRRTRCCKSHVSFRAPFIEMLTAALFITSWIIFAPVSPAKAICGMIFSSALLCATFIDIDHFEIPDLFTIGLAMLGVILSCFVPSLHGQAINAHTPFAMVALISGLLSIKGMLIGSALILWIALIFEKLLRKEVMGFGDVLFLGAIGTFCGWHGTVFVMLTSPMIGTIMFVVMRIIGKFSGKKIIVKSLNPDDAPKDLNIHSPIPYGPLLAVSALLYFFWLNCWFDLWIEEFSQLLWS